jgi:hypothetical protein
MQKKFDCSGKISRNNLTMFGIRNYWFQIFETSRVCVTELKEMGI